MVPRMIGDGDGGILDTSEKCPGETRETQLRQCFGDRRFLHCLECCCLGGKFGAELSSSVIYRK
jgi:hypothetical protein